MCGIVAGVADCNIDPVLIEGLNGVQYCGYDSVGLAASSETGLIRRLRSVGRVADLATQVNGYRARLGTARTSWPIHGAPPERNSDPHISGGFADVHDGIFADNTEAEAQLQADVVAISQSGETADPLASVEDAKARGTRRKLAISNMLESAIVRDSTLRFRTGPEIGVATTVAKQAGKFSGAKEPLHLADLRQLPIAGQNVLALERDITSWSQRFANKRHVLFVGRGHHYTIAHEAALKLRKSPPSTPKPTPLSNSSTARWRMPIRILSQARRRYPAPVRALRAAFASAAHGAAATADLPLGIG
jgi:glucosamine 6-phosphate synthetase-like amidotransferase/phosphosugar isomerase protein